MPKVEFWFDFGSTYSYLSAMRIGQLANTAGVEIAWRPFLLGPIFNAAGWDSSPFLEQPAKLDYMWRDVGRIATFRNLQFHKPPVFPANGVYAARIALVADKEGWIADWSRRVFQAVFADKLDISKPDVLAQLCRDLEQDPQRLGSAAQDPAVKDQLRIQTEGAQKRHIFGAPAFVTDDGELFWGDDRLEMALEWANGPRIA